MIILDLKFNIIEVNLLTLFQVFVKIYTIPVGCLVHTLKVRISISYYGIWPDYTGDTSNSYIHDIQVCKTIALQVYSDKNNRLRNVNAFNCVITPEMMYSGKQYS